MTYAITQSCCADASCVSVCPVNCIHPTPDEPDFGTTDRLYIDPRACIGCGACADACPVDAVFPVDKLTGELSVHAEINRERFTDVPAEHPWGEPHFPRSLPSHAAAPSVAVVGTGPAAGYAVQSLLRSTDAEITLIDRMTTPGGLINYGVAPDHPSTKQIGRTFATSFKHPRVRMHLGVEVGRHVSHAELTEHHNAVVYAVGAPGHRTPGLPGEDLPGTLAAREFVGWCNGHPDVAADAVDLSAERVVVVGNGNVALDAARLLLSDPDELVGTPIAEHALAALRTSRVREVVLLARRGPEHAAFTPSEWVGIQHRLAGRIVVDGHGGAGEAIAGAEDGPAALLRGLPVEDVDWDWAPAGDRRLVLRFTSAPSEVLGTTQVRAIRVGDGTATRDVETGLVLWSVGSRGVQVPQLPFDEKTGTIPNTGGRVQPGTYVVGWAKRGAAGGIGANRSCASETVDALLDDAAAGRLHRPTKDGKAFTKLLRSRT
ncbi:4Fe-4S dicluster domain-containing protein [Saccharopolyspora rhizosphaerae]|uniref:ferredoxin--NADP(+) reductase n=1 Tax=Saccharopolyspora rhizosphaerae TaxID=2492662 RepID=A0A426JNB1_9PSEU|nr:4Fe-4S binding protein [Saccharopolyspora rhizosphaerae]RRO14743.1 4Fe-4S dicluster domain-containing protein [Saccharopolyspora rhizosphaerae]